MTQIVAYLPTYSPFTDAAPLLRPYTRLSQEEISKHLQAQERHIWMAKPSMYMDAIDSVRNIRPDIRLVVGDGRSTDSIRSEMWKHFHQSDLPNNPDGTAAGVPYEFRTYPDKMSQWLIFNDVLKSQCGPETKYFIYTSSDIIWQMDFVAEAIKEFEKNPKLQILFPTMSSGDGNANWQLATGPRDADPFVPPYQEAAKAPVCNAYVMMFRMDFLRTYGGYPTLFRNCYTESFLYYMCQAMGGEMRVLPRGHCFHWNEGDKWTENGSTYYYNQEFELFEGVMNNLQFAKGLGGLTVPFLKNLLYRKET